MSSKEEICLEKLQYQHTDSGRTLLIAYKLLWSTVILPHNVDTALVRLINTLIVNI